MVIVSKEGTEYSLVLDITAEESNTLVKATTTGETIINSLISNGEYLVGLVPQLEIDNAATKTELVSADSQTLLLIDSDNIQIVSITGTATRLPLAPNLSTHVTVNVVANDLGIDLNKVLPML
mmetsp:Transcript_30594/g.46938  ORF Transcript_30594/g.46938 Transcript_30594/m.46938 type:complete len:123 (-) Transcript_30594:10955-11323(-)